jgi:4-amino-4-deoxy-L-arabinose transferase-like glycosyltransferase
LNRVLWILALALIFVGLGARFVALEMSPPGFFIDEAAGAVNVICLSTEGTNESGVSFPFFFPQFGAFFTPVYVYFGAAWIKIFGTSIGAFRAISAFFTLLAIAGVGAIAYRLMGRRGALFTALAATFSPWAFQFSRIAWDPPLMPAFLAWGIYFLIAGARVRSLIASGVLLSLAAYSYPTARLQIPLVVGPILVLMAWRKQLDLKRFAIWCAALIVPSIPLVVLTLNGTLQGRFQLLSVFNPHYGKPGLGGVGLLIENLWKHISPKFLFITGDGNLRHSTQLVGELSWLDAYAYGLGLLWLGWLLYTRIRKEKPPTVRSDGAFDAKLTWLLIGFGIFGGILPAALTWESVPHSLRALGAWPFFALLSGLCLSRAVATDSKVGLMALAVTAVFAFRFGTGFFGTYPNYSNLWFDSVFKETAIHAAQTGDWKPFTQASRDYADVSARYYLIRYGGETCSSSRDRIRLLKSSH